jgi:UDP-glucose 4-epimerase
MNKIIVTGGAGFIGSHLVDALIKKKYEVIVVDNLSSGKISNLNPSAKFFQYDLKEYAKLETIFKDNEIEAIFHLAAQVSVMKSINNPVHDANENIINTLNLIDLCKKYGVKKFICASSAAVYGNYQFLPINENIQLKPISPYGISKLTMELYVENSGLDYTVFRFSNVYGPRQYSSAESGVISIFCNNLINNKNHTIFGNGEQTRDFIFVGDVVEVIINSYEKKILKKTLNLSTNTSISINQIVNLLNQIFNKKLTIDYLKAKSGDIFESRLDNKKLLECKLINKFMLISEGLKQTIKLHDKI